MDAALIQVATKVPTMGPGRSLLPPHVEEPTVLLPGKGLSREKDEGPAYRRRRRTAAAAEQASPAPPPEKEAEGDWCQDEEAKSPQSTNRNEESENESGIVKASSGSLALEWVTARVPAVP
jgi:hypothetical protein